MNRTTSFRASLPMPRILLRFACIGAILLFPALSYAAFTVTNPSVTGTYLDHQDYAYPDGVSGRTTLDPLLPKSIPAGGTAGFLAELNLEFGPLGTVNAGWTFQAGAELNDSKFNITRYEAVGTTAKVGAVFSLDYQAGGSDPTQHAEPVSEGVVELHWIQWITDNHNITDNPGHGNPESIIDITAGVGVPFYDAEIPPTVPFARPPHFVDAPKRDDPRLEHNWHAELYLVSHEHGENSKNVTIYNGVLWGWQNRVVPEPSAIILSCFGTLFLFACANRSRKLAEVQSKPRNVTDC